MLRHRLFQFGPPLPLAGGWEGDQLLVSQLFLQVVAADIVCALRLPLHIISKSLSNRREIAKVLASSC